VILAWVAFILRVSFSCKENVLKPASPKKFIVLLLSALLVLCTGFPAYAASVTLEWRANIEADLVGYRIYYGTSSGNYNGSGLNLPGVPPSDSPVEIDKDTYRIDSVIRITLQNLNDNITYYFVVAAYDDEGYESLVVREICVLGLNDIELPYDKGWAITSGDLEGFAVQYGDPANPPLNDVPTLGSSSDIPPLNMTGMRAVGVPLNLQPSPTVPDFDPPVRIYIPCPGYSDVSVLDIYYWDGADWMLASDADDPHTVQPGAESWMVQGSRDDSKSYAVGIKVYHFSGAQAAGLGTPSSSSTSGGGGGGGGGCFIATAADDV
jgi:hypothetical protein